VKRLRIAVLAVIVVILVIVGGGVAFTLMADDPPPPPRLETREVVPGGAEFRVGSGSFAGYRVDEEYLGVGVNTAVGRTPAVTGTIRVDGTTVTEAKLTADLTQLRSDRAQRDDALTRRGIETGRYPNATFVLDEPLHLSPDEQPAKGTLTLHGHTAPITLTVAGSLAGGRLELAGRAPIAFGDFAIEAPSVAGLVTVRDHGSLEFKLVAEPDGHE
jgi:polyisoprenoid-binding protein YceI